MERRLAAILAADIFTVQDEITEGIVGSVAPETLSAEIKRAIRKTADELDAWNRVLQARWHMARFTERDVVAARQKFHEAIDIDPDLAGAFAELGNSYVLSTQVGISPRDPWRGMWLAGKGIGGFIAERYDDVLEITRENIRGNPELPTPYRQRAATLAVLGRLDEAKAELEKLYERMPNATIAQIERAVPISDPDARRRWLNALRIAGMPEKQEHWALTPEAGNGCSFLFSRSSRRPTVPGRRSRPRLRGCSTADSG